MADNATEKGLSRRGFLTLLGIGVTAGGAIAVGADRLGKAQEDLRNLENLASFLGAPELFPEHPYYAKVTINEGAGVYKEPQKKRSGVVGDVGTTGIGTRTLMGTLANGESIKVENPFLFLREADQFTNEAWGRDVTHAGVTKKADISRSWVIFEVKGQNLPDSIKGLYPKGVACIPIEVSNIDFGGSFEPDLQKITFSQEINFGRVIS